MEDKKLTFKEKFDSSVIWKLSPIRDSYGNTLFLSIEQLKEKQTGNVSKSLVVKKAKLDQDNLQIGKITQVWIPYSQLESFKQGLNQVPLDI